MPTTTTPTTRDDLCLPDHRCIRTAYPTGKIEGGGEVVVIVETAGPRAGRPHKVCDTHVYVVHETSDGAVIRSFFLYGGPSLGGGVRVAEAPMARFNERKVRDQHARVLTNVHKALMPDGEDFAGETAWALSELLVAAGVAR